MVDQRERPMKFVASAVVGLMMLPMGSHAEGGDDRKPWVVANYVHEQCQASDPSRVVECHDYLRGVADTLGYLSDWKACFIKADNTQLRLAFLLYASQHPDELSGPAVKMVQSALTIHFPCK